MDIFLTSAFIVALAEVGDKTQLLAILLAARFGRPAPILLGILAATLLNHGLAALLGVQASSYLDGPLFRYAIALSFIAMAAWTMIPDKLDNDSEPTTRFGPFLTTLFAFFILEIGDKTQIATIALGAQYRDVVTVTVGTTLGMMIANVPAVFLGRELLKRVNLGVVRVVAAAMFLAVGIWTLFQAVGSSSL